MQEVLDAPVVGDPGGELGRGGVEDVWAGDQVDALDRQLPGVEVAAPSHDLDRLAGAGVIDVAERGDLESADLIAVVSPVAGVVVQRDLGPGQLLPSVPSSTQARASGRRRRNLTLRQLPWLSCCVLTAW